MSRGTGRRGTGTPGARVIWAPVTDRAAPTRHRVVVLAGPSGSGKSRLSTRLHATHGWPIFRLDDFYRDQDDPSMPRSEGLGIIDWDHPDSWDADRAVASLCELVDTGRTDTPDYDIARSRASMSETLAVPGVRNWRQPA